MDSMGDNAEARRVIKRYSNRKLYDTRDSRYVTLLQIAEMVRAGEDVQIIDNTTKEDKTEVTLALAISEELKARPRSVPLGTLRNLIQERGGKILTSLRDGPIGRLIPDDGEQESRSKQENDKPNARVEPEKERESKERTSLAEFVATSRHTLDQWQHAIDERIRAVLPSYSLFMDIQAELRRLTQRVQFLEEKLGARLQDVPEEKKTEPKEELKKSAAEENSLSDAEKEPVAGE